MVCPVCYRLMRHKIVVWSAFEEHRQYSDELYCANCGAAVANDNKDVEILVIKEENRKLQARIKELEEALAVTAAHITAAEIEIDHAEIENLTLQARLKELEEAPAVTAAIDDVAIVRAVMRAKEISYDRGRNETL